MAKEQALKDKVGAVDEVKAEVFKHPPGAQYWACPKCNSAMKEDQEPGWRICASKLCRHRAEQSTLKMQLIYEVRYPCPVCGRETKDHHGSARICSRKDCRHEVPKADVLNVWPDFGTR
jgi:hypothetical protein